MGRLRNAWDAITGKGLFSGEAPATDHASGLLKVLSGTQAPRRGTRELLQAYKRLPYLHSISRRIASDVASVPWTVSAARGKKAKAVAAHVQRASGEVRLSIERAASGRGELEELASHPFLDVLSQWNPAIGPFESEVAVCLYHLFIGQAPIVQDFNAIGQPLELWPVAPHWIAETPRPGYPHYRASFGGWQATFPEEAVLWLRAVDLENPYGRGTSYGEALGDELDVGELRARYAKNFFHNHARPDSIISYENSQNLDHAKVLANELESKHRGARNVGRPLVTAGKIGYQALQQTWADMQLSEQRAEDRRIVQEVLNFPPELMGVLDNSNRSTIDAAMYLYMRGVVVPLKERLRAGLQTLLAKYDDRLVLGFVNPIPEDVEAHRRHMVAVPSAFRVNEHRRAGGQTELDGEEGEALFAPPAAPSPFGPVGLSAGDPPWAKSLPRGVTKSDEAMRRALAALLPERLTTEIAPIQEEEFRRWAEAVLGELGVGVSFDMRNPLVRETLAKAGEKIRGVTETTLEQLRNHLQEGVFAGEGTRDLAKRVGEVFDHAEGYRSERIARTEVVGSSNAANLAAWQQSGVVDGKEWLSVRDGQTRDEHRELDGQRVGLMDVFSTREGRKTQHPGGFGVAELDINCRCAAVPVVNEGVKAWDEADKVARWKKYDAALLPWEARLLEAVRRGFRRQREDVLRVLEGGR